MSQDILFDDIQRQIVSEIRSAKYVIWIARAWFTDPVLFEEFVKKKKQGVTIEIVVDYNDKNRNADFSLDSEFPTHFLLLNIALFQFYKFMSKTFSSSSIVIAANSFFIVISSFRPIKGSMNYSLKINYTKFIMHNILVR